MTFEEAKEIVKKNNIKSSSEYREFYTRIGRNLGLTSNPNRTYKKEWKGFIDFLQIEKELHSNNIHSKRVITYKKNINNKYYSYDECKEFISNIDIYSISDFNKFANDSDNIKIPKKPNQIYKEDGWISWKEFLPNYGNKPKFLSYEDAKNDILKFNIKNSIDWYEFCKSSNKPSNIPSSPYYIYKNNGWISWSDWLNVNPYRPEYLDFQSAKIFVIGLNLNSTTEWREYCKSGNKPSNIPANAHIVYKEKWISWNDWLGTENISNQIINKENNKKILNYLLSIQSSLKELDIIELVTIIQQSEGGFIYEKISKNPNFKKIINSQSDDEKSTSVDNLINDYTNEDYEEPLDSLSLDNDVIETENINDIIDYVEEDKDEDTLTKTKRTMKQLQSLDDCMITSCIDDEAINFLIKRKINTLWNSYMNNELDINIIRTSSGGKFYTQIKDIFFNEFDNLSIWDWRKEIENDFYRFKEPNLMQKLFVKRVIENKQYGNWSGVGSGKTLAAILATKLTKSKNTLIITFNSTTDNWEKSINEYFTNNNVIIKDKNPKFKDNTSNYLILNYEFFQQPNSESYVYKILNENNIDFIILDEVHLTKQRDESISKRREIILKLLSTAHKNNPNLYQIGMSATPVVNNLVEAKTLLEMLMSIEYNDLDTNSTINNALQIHKHLVINGIRYKPKYDISIQTDYPTIDGHSLIKTLAKIDKGKVVEYERVLLDLKLSLIPSYLKKGTIIYTEYIDGMVNPIKDFCENLGYKVGLYTGDNKDGKDKFILGEVDILIGSKPISTGVDGLQKVCDNLIILSLPWTNSDYEQLVGRIYRQGSKFGLVKVIIPKVEIELDNCDIWSWDKDRLDRITFKKTLSDCAVDGIVPSDKILSQSALFNRAKKALDNWIDRVKDNDILSIERRQIEFPLEPKDIINLKPKLGDFSELNRKWSISNSNNTFDRIKSDPSEWYYYHTLYSEKRKDWNEIPYLEISKKIKDRPDWIIGDFGCGENLLSKEITNKVYAFDYISIDENVIVSDISNVPLVDCFLDVVVFSLSLMGSNFEDYLKEAYRVLKPYGTIFICEPIKKWDSREDDLIKTIEKIGFSVYEKSFSNFFYLSGLKTK